MYRDPVFHNCTGKYKIHGEKNVKISNCEILGDLFIGYNSYINSGFIRSYVEIGRYCSIGRNVSIALGVHDHSFLSTSPFFEKQNNNFKLPLAQENPKRRVIIGNDV
ncbi:unnamed protein product, partial [marine sediment metagenome]